MNIKFERNEILPVINKDFKALLLNGSGTYSIKLNAKVNNINVQQNPSFGQKVEATVKTDTNVTHTINGTVKVYAKNKKIDSNKDIIVTKKGIENMKTENIVFDFDQTGKISKGEFIKDLHWKWEDGEEKSETHTEEINSTSSQDSFIKVYFKFDK